MYAPLTDAAPVECVDALQAAAIAAIPFLTVPSAPLVLGFNAP
jgi:hypothetical protein